MKDSKRSINPDAPKRRSLRMLVDIQDVLLIAGVLFLEAGIAAIYWPMALIVLGLLCFRAVWMMAESKQTTNGPAN